MKYFEYVDGSLCAEQVNLADIAAAVGTPTYVYSKASILAQYRAYTNGLGSHPGLVCFAVKSNSNLAVLKLLADAGAGFDIVSAGELERVLLAGGKPEKIIFSGVGKTVTEMRRALDVGIACFNVESLPEIERLAEVAASAGKVAPVSVRVNPDVDAKTHPYISTGLKENKFGIDIAHAEAAYQRIAQLPSLKIVGVDCHIGSQLTDLTPFGEACDKLLALIDSLAAQGIKIRHLDVGGGVGVVYRNEKQPSIDEYFQIIKAKVGERKLAIFCEPGRFIVANAGALLTKVELLKETDHKRFAIIDAAMNDLIRPALYQAWQQVLPVAQTSNASPKQWDLVGPVCESTDFLARDRELALQSDALLAIMSAGAYCFVMSSNYNSRPRAAEVMVDGDTFTVVRQRETFADLVRGETTLD